MLLPLLTARPARSQGMAARQPPLRPEQAAAAFALAAACAFALIPARTALLALAAAAAVGLAMTRLAVRQIGGYSGDVLGAVELAVECVVLSLLSARP
jgi:adenosylcobinamide-GDP ribazoletransferase